MKTVLAALLAAATLAACADLPNTSRATFAMPLLDNSTIGRPDYPVVVRGAESVGMSADALARSLRFPAFLSAGSTFRAVEHSPGMVNHAHLTVTPKGENASATLTFLHGERRIGEGIFTLPRAAFADPVAVGNISAPLISSILQRAADFKRDSDREIWVPN